MIATIIISNNRTHCNNTIITYSYAFITDYLYLSIDKAITYF
jgi:hypothetical protein